MIRSQWNLLKEDGQKKFIIDKWTFIVENIEIISTEFRHIYAYLVWMGQYVCELHKHILKPPMRIQSSQTKTKADRKKNFRETYQKNIWMLENEYRTLIRITKKSNEKKSYIEAIPWGLTWTFLKKCTQSKFRSMSPLWLKQLDIFFSIGMQHVATQFSEMYHRN